MRRARMLDELTRALETKVTELVGGLSTASAAMEETAQSMSSTATVTNRQAAVVAADAASEADFRPNACRPSPAPPRGDWLPPIAEIGRQVAQSTEITNRAVDNARRTGRDRALARRGGRAENRRCRVTLIQNIAAQHQQPARAERDDRSRARRRCRPRLRRGRLGGQIAGRANGKSHHRNLRTDRGDPGGQRRNRSGDQKWST